MNVDLVAELNLARQQTEEYKSKYFQCLKDIENKNKEIEGLRSMMLQTQSLRGTDGRQSDDLRRNLQVALSENSQLKQQIEDLRNQNSNQFLQPQQLQYQTQYEINRLNNDMQLLKGNYDILQQQLDQKTKDYDQLKVRIQAIDFIQNMPQGQEANKILVIGKEIQRLNAQLINKDQEIEQLKVTLGEQQRAVQERDNLSQQLRAYEDKVRNLSSDIENMLMQVGGLRHDVALKQELERVKSLLQESEREVQAWKDKYAKLENDSKHLQELERKTNDYEARLIRTSEENERLEQENRGIQLKLQAFDRLLKDKENIERKMQDQEQTLRTCEQQVNEKRREIESLRLQNRELEQDFINFKENIFRPNEERQKRLELEIENWRNKCLALESNFFGNNERHYIQNEMNRLHALVVTLQQENEELKNRKTAAKTSYGDEQRVRILYQERERLYIELEEARRRIAALERQPQKLALNFTEEEKDQQLEELKQGIEQLIDENKGLKVELDNKDLKIEQLEIDNNYIRSKQIAPRETVLDMISKWPDLHKNVLENLIRRLYQDAKDKEKLIEQMNQNPTVTQQLQREQRIIELEQQIQLLTSVQAKPQPQVQSLNNSGVSGSPGKRNIFQENQVDVQKVLEEYSQLKRQYDELRLQKDFEFVEQLEAKERDIELMRQKFSQQPENIVDLRKLREMLEQKSYEAQEWKDKFTQLQMQQRLRDNQSYERPFSQSLLEQEYRKLKQLYEMKTIEVDEMRQQGRMPATMSAMLNQELPQQDVNKLKRLLEMRTAECEEWRSKYLKLNMNPGQAGNNSQELEEQVRRIKHIHDQKHKEAEEWKLRYNQLVKNRDQGAGQAVDELQAELTKIKRLHDVKHQELQELLPRLQGVKLLQQEKEVYESELRRLKYALEQQQTENDQLKQRLNNLPLGNQQNQSERVIREYQQKIQLLQQQLQQAQGQLNDFNSENAKLKQTHMMKQDQIKSIAMNMDGKDQQLRQLFEENQKLKTAIDSRLRENEELKQQLSKASQALQQQAKEFLEYKKSTQSVEAYKAQLAIAQNKIQEGEKKVQQGQADLQKLQTLLRDKMGEIEKLKESLQKVNQFQQEKNQVVQQLQQAKTMLQEKQKEQDKLKQQYAQMAQQYQKLVQSDNETKQQLDKLKAVLGSFQK